MEEMWQVLWDEILANYFRGFRPTRMPLFRTEAARDNESARQNGGGIKEGVPQEKASRKQQTEPSRLSRYDTLPEKPGH